MNEWRGDAESAMLTTAQAAQYAGVSRKSIYRAIEDGRLKASRLLRGQRLLIRREWLDEWIDAGIITHRDVSYDPSAEWHQPRRGLLRP